MFKNQKIKINWWNRLELFVFSRELQNAKNTIGVWYYVFNTVMTNGRWVVGSLGRMSVLLMKPYKSTFLMLELIYDSYMSWSTMLVSLKACVGFSTFLYFPFFIFNFIIPSKIKITEKPHTLLLPDLWFLSCNKKF